ncbi:MAG TPA: serine/threonine-protein kinase [Polyangiaceae bacterium]|jgi:serine/threonine-protein kinase
MQPEATSAPRVVGRYKLYGEIGGGGMATVHLARLQGSVGFGRLVAIKRMHGMYTRDPEFVAMFVDEARVAARVHHPNVVQTLDVVADEGELFLVMEHVHGVPMTRLLKTGAIDPRMACAIASGMLHGLHAAHEATDESGTPLEIVHRDVSPQNLLVGADGTARVLDFGIAKATGRQHATRDGVIKGKCAYMAPEQITNVRVDRQCDVFAASIVLWEALTGQRLFRAETERDTLARVMALPIPPPSKHVPTISPELDAIVLRGLERDLDRRYKTAREMARDLERLPLAPQSDVGEWVSTVAAAELGKRLEQISEIERGVTSLPDLAEVHSGIRDNPTAPQTPNALPREEGTQLSSTFSEPEPRAKRRPALWAGGLFLALLLVGGSVVGTRAWVSARAQAAAIPPAIVTVAQPQKSAAPQPVTTVYEFVDTPATTESSSARPAPHQPATHPHLVPPPPSATAPAPTVDCSSPSYVGPDNRVHYKLECLKTQ